ncbi:MAG: hypothetical protein ABSB33_10125 [Tepidisphaeraceae bacterium]|jgi:hypothetical protein
MARYIGKIRRLASLRSVAARPTNGAKFPHEIYMRLCCLEMERFRREQEQSVAVTRARKCMERCHHIEMEVQELLRSIGQASLIGAGSGSDDARPEVAAVRDASKLMFTY